jgi:TonB family protein
MPTIPVTSQRGSGKGLSLVVTEVRNANGGRDLPDTPVQSAASTPNFLTPATKAFPDVVYPSEVSLNLKSKITVRVLIDRDGKPQTVDVLQGSQSEVYDREAKELLQTLLQEMSFVPAQQNGQPVDTLLDVDLSLAPL